MNWYLYVGSFLKHKNVVVQMLLFVVVNAPRYTYIVHRHAT